MPKVIPPLPDADEQFFWDGVAAGELLLRRCASCGQVQHPPSPMCPHCGSLEWEALAASGRGTVHSWIVSHHPTEPDDAARIVALIDLEEGVRLVSNLTDVDSRRRRERYGGRGRVPRRGRHPAPAIRAGGGSGMSDVGMRRAAAVVGIGQTEFSKQSGRSELQLASEAVRAALRDAGLQPSDVDGLVTLTIDTNDELDLMRSVGIQEVRWTSRTPFGGGGASRRSFSTLRRPWPQARPRPSWSTARSTSARGGASASPTQPGPAPGMTWTLPYGLDTPAKMYSLWFQSYMHRFGLENADFGRYTVVAREYAATNPNAWFYKRPITLEDHQNSRWIVEPILRLLDCCQESDGGVAFVVTSPERARDLAQPPALIAAAAQGNTIQGDTCSTTTTPTPRASPKPNTSRASCGPPPASGRRTSTSP